MTLEERIAVLEKDSLSLRCELVAAKIAVHALAGEDGAEHRLGLFEDLADATVAKWLGLTIADAQLDHAKQVFESAVMRLREGFLRAYIRTDVRNPAQRKADGITHYEAGGRSWPRRPLR